jgi:MFS family permease
LLIDPLKDRVFRNFVSYGAVITFTVTVSSWFFWRLSTEGLGFSKLGTNCLFMVIGPLAGTLAAMGWGKLQDRWGRRPVLIVATIGTTISLLPWFFASRHLGNPQFMVDFINWISTGMGRLWGWDNWQLVGPGSPLAAYLLCALGCIIGGAAWTGVGLAQTGVVLGFSDGHGRSKYVAASAVLISVGGTLGGLVGGTVAQSLEFLHVHPIRLGLFEWNNWHVTFAISVIGRLASLAWLANMPDPGARSVRDMLRYWSENVYNSVFSRMFFPLRIFGWGRPDEDGQGERKR